MKTGQENEKRTQENQWNKEPSDLWNAQKTEIGIRDGFKKSGKSLSCYNDLHAW